MARLYLLICPSVHTLQHLLGVISCAASHSTDSRRCMHAYHVCCLPAFIATPSISTRHFLLPVSAMLTESHKHNVAHNQISTRSATSGCDLGCSSIASIPAACAASPKQPPAFRPLESHRCSHIQKPTHTACIPMSTKGMWPPSATGGGNACGACDVCK
jgi:hypothetical protein